jgi:vacuolar-type H+-ATPase subunit H
MSDTNDTQAELAAWELLAEARRERDEWKAEAKRWRDMYMQFDEMLESDIKDATEKVSDIIAQVEKLSKEMDKGY